MCNTQCTNTQLQHVIRALSLLQFYNQYLLLILLTQTKQKKSHLVILVTLQADVESCVVEILFVSCNMLHFFIVVRASREFLYTSGNHEMMDDLEKSLKNIISMCPYRTIRRKKKKMSNENNVIQQDY